MTSHDDPIPTTAWALRFDPHRVMGGKTYQVFQVPLDEDGIPEDGAMNSLIGFDPDDEKPFMRQISTVYNEHYYASWGLHDDDPRFEGRADVEGMLKGKVSAGAVQLLVMATDVEEFVAIVDLVGEDIRYLMTVFGEAFPDVPMA